MSRQGLLTTWMLLACLLWGPTDFSVSSTVPAGTDVVPEPAPPKVVVSPLEPTFPAAQGAWFRVVIDNGVRACEDVAVSSYLAGLNHSLPDTVLTFDITEASGNRIKPTPWTGTRMGFRPKDLIVLRCSTLHGWHIPLKVEWEYKLPPGRYRLVARVENRMRAYFDSHASQLRELAKALDLSVQEVRPLLRDFVAVSDAVEFAIE